MAKVKNLKWISKHTTQPDIQTAADAGNAEKQRESINLNISKGINKIPLWWPMWIYNKIKGDGQMVGFIPTLNGCPCHEEKPVTFSLGFVNKELTLMTKMIWSMEMTIQQTRFIANQLTEIANYFEEKQKNEAL